MHALASQTHYTVSLQILGIPESNGLRIRLLNPKGLYVASFDPEAAKTYFERMSIQILMMDNLLTLEPGDGIETKNPIDWNSLIAHGGGDIDFVPIHESVIEAHIHEGMLTQPSTELKIDRWERSDGRPFYVVRDVGDSLDTWFVPAMREDLGIVATS